MMNFARITLNPKQMNGVACVRGLRIPIATVVGMVADGMTEPEIIAAYPDLEREDIREALRYAAEAIEREDIGAALRYAAEAVRECELPLTIPWDS